MCTCTCTYSGGVSTRSPELLSPPGVLLLIRLAGAPLDEYIISVMPFRGIEGRWSVHVPPTTMPTAAASGPSAWPHLRAVVAVCAPDDKEGGTSTKGDDAGAHEGRHGEDLPVAVGDLIVCCTARSLQGRCCARAGR